jgi:hypothetical protein
MVKVTIPSGCSAKWIRFAVESTSSVHESPTATDEGKGPLLSMIESRPWRTRLYATLKAAALVLLVAAASSLGSAPAGAQMTPSVTGQAGAQDAEVIVNQVDSGRFPKVTVFATVLRRGQPVKGLTAADFRVREDEVDQAPSPSSRG